METKDTLPIEQALAACAEKIHVIGGKPASPALGQPPSATPDKAARSEDTRMAIRWQKWGDALTKKIEYNRRPMTQNPTPKRRR